MTLLRIVIICSCILVLLSSSSSSSSLSSSMYKGQLLQVVDAFAFTIVPKIHTSIITRGKVTSNTSRFISVAIGRSTTTRGSRTMMATTTTTTTTTRKATTNNDNDDDDDDNDNLTNTSTERATKKVYNILCLHGKGNNGKSFQQVLKPLEQSLKEKVLQQQQQQTSFNFEYMTAPFPMNTENENNDNNNDGPMQWWTLPPGVRSFNAKEYTGFEKSAKNVINEIVSKSKLQASASDDIIDSQLDSQLDKGYDFIIGHSQGAILLSALLTSDLWKEHIITMKKPMLGYILNGCAWPNPFSDTMINYKYETTTISTDDDKIDNHSNNDNHNHMKQPQFLFVVGEKDIINPPEGAIRVRDALQSSGLLATNIQTCYHPGGHSVPVKDEEALDTMTNWIMGVVEADDDDDDDDEVVTTVMK